MFKKYTYIEEADLVEMGFYEGGDASTIDKAPSEKNTEKSKEKK